MSDNKLEEKLDKINLSLTENFAVIKTTISQIEGHLKKLNGTVAKHEDKLNNKRLIIQKIDSRLVILEELHHVIRENSKRYKNMWIERVIWFVFAAGLSVVTNLFM